MKIDFDALISGLNPLQKKKLRMAAEILRATARLYDDSKDQNLLPLWGGGVISHGLPKSKSFVIGTTRAAKDAEKGKTTHDHLFRVTETARHILCRHKKEHLTVEEIESILIRRSIMMKTTKSENSGILKRTLKLCTDPDNWEELYRRAEIEYEIYSLPQCSRS